LLAGPQEWNRRRLQILLGAGAVVVLAVAAGIVWSVLELLQHGSASSSATGQGHDSKVARLPAYGGDGSLTRAQPGPLSAESVAGIKLPQPAAIGAAQVGTGVPHSPGGAMAQLIAIDQRAIASASVVTAQDVITAWAAPGGPTPTSWSGVAAVQTLLESAGLPANGSSDLTIQLDPEMGRIQHAGEEPTVCVDFVLSATVRGGAPTQSAVADCQHMTWLGGRWVIASGPEATPTASLWPGTQASYDAGYEWLEIQP
jgi:hypothetical protein